MSTRVANRMLQKITEADMIAYWFVHVRCTEYQLEHVWLGYKPSYAERLLVIHELELLVPGCSALSSDDIACICNNTHTSHTTNPTTATWGLGKVHLRYAMLKSTQCRQWTANVSLTIQKWKHKQWCHWQFCTISKVITYLSTDS